MGIKHEACQAIKRSPKKYKNDSYREALWGRMTEWGVQVMTVLLHWNACIRLIKAWNLSARVEERAVVTSE
jgi:hypothetical protein